MNFQNSDLNLLETVLYLISGDTRKCFPTDNDLMWRYASTLLFVSECHLVNNVLMMNNTFFVKEKKSENRFDFDGCLLVCLLSILAFLQCHKDDARYLGHRYFRYHFPLSGLQNDPC